MDLARRVLPSNEQTLFAKTSAFIPEGGNISVSALQSSYKQAPRKLFLGFNNPATSGTVTRRFGMDQTTGEFIVTDFTAGTSTQRNQNAFRSQLQNFAMIIGGIVYRSSLGGDQTSQDISLYRIGSGGSINRDTLTNQLDTVDRQDPTKVEIAGQPFIFDANTGLEVDVVDDPVLVNSMSLTLDIVAMVPYDRLEVYMARATEEYNRLIQRSR